MGADQNVSAKLSDRMNSSWLKGSDLRSIAAQVGTPVFIYSEAQLARNAARIRDAAASAGLAERVELYVPFFPNSNPHVLAPLRSLGIGLLVQLPAEYEILRRYGFNNFIVSPGHVSNEDIEFWAKLGHPLFLSSLDEVSHLLRVNPAAAVNVRLDTLSSGKPGIKYNQIKDLSTLLKQHDRRLNCYEVYCGSGNTLEQMVGIIEQVFMIFRTYFETAACVNFAGGYGFSYEEWHEPRKHFDWNAYFRQLQETAERFGIPKHVKFLFEPARDVLADVGVHLLSVKRAMIKNSESRQILTNGSRVLMPSAQYKDRRHNVVFLDHAMTEMEPGSARAALRGRGILRHDYVLPGEYPAPEDIGAGDHVLILDVGAYCATQHMEFLNIPPAGEVLIGMDGKRYLVTSPGGEFDKWRFLLKDRQELTS